ncbi:MAG TPA: transglycosylase SLT domain-containing protein [Bradyrhizobium sp.]|nr:transglycosylase SLT domain-containing protein [Bradyrhizobium sp.]
MKRCKFLGCAIVAVLSLSHGANAQDRTAYETLIATHAQANLVPEALVHRVIVRESRYRADLVGRGGTIGLMQIKLATARGVGYAGNAEGLRDPGTNLAYGVKYLAGAYRAARGDQNRAMHYYASGYYHVAKQQRQERLKPVGAVLASVPRQTESVEQPEQSAAPQEQVAAPQEIAKPSDVPTRPKRTHAKPRQQPSKKLADAKTQVPRPPATMSDKANPAKPR